MKFLGQTSLMDLFHSFDTFQKEMETHCLYLMIEVPKAKFHNDIYSIVYFESEALWKKDKAAVTSPDPELGLENLCEMKHLMMTRNARTGIIDRNLKPNAAVRETLSKIIEVCVF